MPSPDLSPTPGVEPDPAHVAGPVDQVSDGASVAILIPTLDAVQDLSRLVPALDAQASQRPIERIAVDSSSTDATVERLRAAGFLVEVIDRSDFGHGRTRNQLAGLAKAEYLLFLSQDATPVDPGFIEAMLRPFEDLTVGGVMARVLPNPDDDPLTARTVLEGPEASEDGVTRRLPEGSEAGELAPSVRAGLLRFNNVASCVRKRLLDEIPFPEVPFGEDFAWAARVMSAGWGIRYEPSAAVYHAHRYSPRQALRRYRVDAEFHREFHGVAIRPSVFSVVKGFAYECRRDVQFLLRRGIRSKGFFPALFRAPALRFAQVLGQYQGSRGRAAAGSSWDAARSSGALDS